MPPASAWLMVAAAVSTAACTLVPESGPADGGSGSGGSAGASGASGAGAAAGMAGAGGTPGREACEGLPPGGRCFDSGVLERCLWSERPEEDPKVLLVPCPGNTRCVEGEEGAACRLFAACHDGERRCQGDTLETCVAGDWSRTSCAPAPCVISTGFGAACAPSAPGATTPLVGRLTYEYLVPDGRRSDYDPTPRVDAARGVIAAAFDAGEFVGAAYTDLDEGHFEIRASRPPTSETFVYFYPVLYDDVTGRPELAVARPRGPDLPGLSGSEYWWWGVAAEGRTDLGTIPIRVDEGSGALHVYSWLLYARKQAQAFAPSVVADPVVALWQPGMAFGCGNGTCYLPKGWGVTVGEANERDFFPTAVLLAGTAATPHEWSRSVILHEYGHGVMDVYSRLPNEADRHSVASTCRPGQAWSDGWASYFGQWTMRDPIYFDKQEGLSWWFDVEKSAIFGTQQGPKPDPRGPLDQPIGELVVATMLWHLSDPAGGESWDRAEIADETLFRAFGSQRMMRSALDVGYRTVDFADFLHSLRCEGVNADVLASVTGHFGYPDAGTPVCAR